MKINYLIKNIDNEDFDLVSKLKVNPYIPVMDKHRIVMDIISIYTDEIDGGMDIDNFRMGIEFDMCMIKEHTNLDIAEDFSEMVEQYDVLCKSGVMTKVLALFVDDYYFMKHMLEQELEKLEKEYSLERYLIGIVHKFNRMLDDIDIGKLLPEGMDIGALLDLMNLK